MLEDFIKANKLAAKVFATTREVRTSQKAALELGLGADSVAKSILLIASTGEPVLVVLLGKDRVDFSKIKALLNAGDVRLAEPDEVLEITGYEVGGVPPISIYGVAAFMDTRVAKKEEVVCGGGDEFHLMRIKVKEILENAEGIRVESVIKAAAE